MDWANLNVSIFATFVTIVTVVLGSVIAVGSWMVSMSEPPYTSEGSLAPVRTLAIAVALDLLALPALWLVPDTSKSVVWFIFLIAGFGFMLASIALEYRDRRPEERRFLRFGLWMVLAANVVGLIGIIVSMPGMPLH